MKKVTFEELKKMVGEYGHFTVFVHKDTNMLSCFFAEVNEKSMGISFGGESPITIYTLAEVPEIASAMENYVLNHKPHNYVEDEEYEQMKKDFVEKKGTVAYANGPYFTTYMLLSLGDSNV